VPERFHGELVAAGKLVAAGELTAGLAHEINNPLFAILGLLEFLLDEVEPGSKAHERLLVIQETGTEIKEIIRVLADFTREPTRSRRVVSLVDVARGAVELARRTGSARSLEIVERYPHDEPRVDASPGQLKQVVLHLLSNARHALPDGGTVTVEVAAEASEAVLSVADTGPGVPDAVAAEVFDLFWTTREDGTGLGLAVSRAIAAAHGGTLDLDTPSRGGAHFSLRLPRSADSP
jgi:signal transduction histidine kinase